MGHNELEDFGKHFLALKHNPGRSPLERGSHRLWERLSSDNVMYPQEKMSYRENRYPVKGSHLLRVGRWSFPGNCYFVTASTLNRLPILTDPTCCQIVFDSIEWLEKEKKIECYCCIIMPDHIHLAMRLGPDQTLSQVMQSLKGYTAREINRLKGKKGHVWQDQYHDHLIRKEEDMRNIILYCYENPVRRKIVQEANGYPFWSCKFEIE